MQEYYLFLDESKPNSNFENFTLGGICIEKETYVKSLIPLVNKIKVECFGTDSIILHDIDIRKKGGQFKGIGIEQQKKFYGELYSLFDTKDIFKIFGVSINMLDFRQLYNAEHTNDIYYISLQLLMENFTHFLVNNNGKGTVYLESTDPGNNSNLQNLFYLLKATGTLFFKKESLQEKLSTINFAIKSENNIGLQIADFVLNPLAREALGKKQKLYPYIDVIHRNLYDGCMGMPQKFGFKIIK